MAFSRLFSWHKPKIKVRSSKKDGFSGWFKCSGCSETIHASELSEFYNICPKCGFHYRISALHRIKILLDENSFTELFRELQPADPLAFCDEKPYVDRIEAAKEKTGRDEAIVVGTGRIDGVNVVMAALDFTFMGGSMGSVVGERLTSGVELATERGLPIVIVSASGGARMQESIHSLMQMAKTSAALAKHAEAKLPYISILTNPTMGGVTASFASLGDIILAEPKALIGFAGPRVVEQTTKQKLPEGAQTAEFLLEHGMIDKVVSRRKLKETTAYFLRFLQQGHMQKVAEVKDSRKSWVRESLDVSGRLKKFISVAVSGQK